jgi:AraC-like DNA-binding protein
MRVAHKDLRETHLVGADTPEKLIDPPISPLMNALHLGLAGVSDAGEGFEMVRLKPAFGHVVACFSGEGKVLLNGRWQTCGPGMAYLTPPNQPHAYRTIPGVRWGFAWVWWIAPRPGETPLIACDKPLLVRADPEYLRSAILGLYRESMGPAHGPEIDHWVELVHAYTVRLGEQIGRRKRHRTLIELWELVDSDLSRPWTRQMLADAAGMSGEHLRRLCRRENGVGPIQHLTALRMRRAGMLLESTDQKIGAIASAVGYENAFAFSTAFKRQTGTSPAAYRTKRRVDRRPRAAVRTRAGGGTPPVIKQDLQH